MINRIENLALDFVLKWGKSLKTKNRKLGAGACMTVLRSKSDAMEGVVRVATFLLEYKLLCHNYIYCIQSDV